MTSFHDSAEQLRFKQALKDACLQQLEQRIANARQAMEHAQESANQEDKSSAGDKYETARAMGQLDRDMNARQLQEALLEEQFLQGLNCSSLQDSVLPGAVILAGDQCFFIAIGLGLLSVDDRKLIVLSPKSPLYAALKMKKAGEEFSFQGKLWKIENVF